jgi:hypothetical protein
VYRLSEEVVHKILRNIRSSGIGPVDINEKDPFEPKNKHSIGFLDPYCAIGTDFNYVLEFPYPFINQNLPPLDSLNGYWLYRRDELKHPDEPFEVPRYLADPNIQDGEEVMDVSDCAVIIPSDVEKLTCKSILTFEKLIEIEPMLLDCLNKDLK